MTCVEQARIKSLAAGDAFTNSVQSFRDPFECLRVWTDAEVDHMVERIHPHIYRLMSVLKTIDSNKYKASNLPWMIVGMLYMCTCGHTIGNVMVLPRVQVNIADLSISFVCCIYVACAGTHE